MRFPGVSDERLSRRLAAGEAAAFDELYRRYAHRLAAYATGLLGDRAAAEDVAQVTLLNAYQALRAGRGPERVRPWLYRIAHNEAVDMLARRREILDGLDRDEAPAPEDGALVRGHLLEALAQLPERQRRVYVLREVHGLKVAEVAAELALTVQQVEQALFAARNRLAEQLVFGERLGCDSAQRLAEGPLSLAERRALRRHFRACPSCKGSAASGRVALPGLLPLPFDWLRGRLAELLAGASAPVAVKTGAVVAAASVAAGVSIGPRVLHRTPPVSVPTTTAPAPVLPESREQRQASAPRTALLAVPAAFRSATVGRRRAAAPKPTFAAGPVPAASRAEPRAGAHEQEHGDTAKASDDHGDRVETTSEVEVEDAAGTRIETKTETETEPQETEPAETTAEPAETEPAETTAEPAETTATESEQDSGSSDSGSDD